jgi:hypothetical protein
VGVTLDALSGSSVEERTAAASAAGEDAADWGGKSLSGDWMASSCETGKETFGDAGAASGCETAGCEPADGETSGVETSAGAPDGDGVPGVPAFSGLFSLMTVGQAPSTRTNGYGLIIRYRERRGKPAHNYSHCYAAVISRSANPIHLWIRLLVESFA